MDEEINLYEMKELVKGFCEERDWDQFHNAKDLAIGVVTEASELLDLFRFKSYEEVDEMFKDDLKRLLIGEELADVFYFVLRFAQKYGIDLSSELKKKIHKNNEKYPVERAKGSNKKYTEL